jgi:hypothetical protein
MPKTGKILNYIILFILIVFLSAACAPARKNPYYQKRKKSTQVTASQLGRNKYFFSKEYQKKLTRTYKKK